MRIVEPTPGSHLSPSVTGETTLYRFHSADETFTVTLAQDFVAVATSAYQGWPEYSALIAQAVLALRDVYQPSGASRIGLRYVNILTLENAKQSNGAELAAFVRSELSTRHHLSGLGSTGEPDDGVAASG